MNHSLAGLMPGHHGSITYTYLRADKHCGGAEVFEDQNTLQHGTLTSCSGTLTSTPTTAVARLSCQRDCAKGAEASTPLSFPLSWVLQLPF